MSDVVFLGSDEGAAHCLEVLAASHGVSLVVTPPERRRGRGGHATPTPVGAAAARLGIPVLATPDVNLEEDVARVRAAEPRLLVVVAFGQLLRRAVRDVPSLGSLNLHFSLLPRWRGAAPVQRALLAGDAGTGACVQRLVARLDAGAVLAAAHEPILARDDTPVLRARLVARGAPLLRDVVTALLRGDDVPAIEQDEALVTLAPRIDVHEGDVDPLREDAWELDRRVRALHEWPGCHARLVRPGRADVPVLVREALPEPGTAEPGAVVSADADGVVVGAARGLLRITRLQKPGKRELPVRDFLNGCRLLPGDRLAPP